MTLSITTLAFSALAILQVGVVLGMWLKSVLSGGYDFHIEGRGYQSLPGRDDATLKLPPRAP